MNLHSDLSFAASANAFETGLPLEVLARRTPAAFADSAHERTSSKYSFIPTERVLNALMNAGFVVVDARQTKTRSASPMHARHVLRLRRRFETVQLKDSIPEVVFLNSHDGTSAYQLRMGLYRAVCTNGLIVSRAAFPAVCVSHRGNVVDAVIEGALTLSERFESLAEKVEQMEQRQLSDEEQITFAAHALQLRFPDYAQHGLRPQQMLFCRRMDDYGTDLWRTFNRVQENLIGGGHRRQLPNGRRRMIRGITAIKEDIRINSGLWDLASGMLAA